MSDIEEIEVEVEETEAEVTDEAEEQEVEPTDEVDQETEEPEEIVVSFGEDSPPPAEEKEHAPEWVKELRKKQRETAAENKRLKAEMEALKNPAPKTETIGKKPVLSDFDYDADEFENALTQWHEKKREIAKQEEERKAAEDAEKQAWQSKLNSYQEAKTKLKVKDFDDAEATVQDSFDVTQQGILLQGSEDPALLIYALGSNKAQIEKLSSIKDPIKFAFAVAKLEAQMKVTGRQTPPPPEKKLGSAQKSTAAGDSTLERLRAKAEKTGDYTEVTAYKAKMRKK